jgi:amino acid transporter
VSFVDGWLTLVGNWTVTLSINFSGAQMMLSAITLWNEDHVPIAWQTLLMFRAVMLLHALVNIFGSGYLNLINKLAMYWIVTAVLIILVVTLSMAYHKNDAAYIFGHYDTSASGWQAGVLSQNTVAGNSEDLHVKRSSLASCRGQILWLAITRKKVWIHKHFHVW